MSTPTSMEKRSFGAPVATFTGVPGADGARGSESQRFWGVSAQNGATEPQGGLEAGCATPLAADTPSGERTVAGTQD